MLETRMTTAFRRDLKACRRRNFDILILQEIIEKLKNGQAVDQYRDHALIGNWTGHRELHITNDWLLIYKVVLKDRTLLLVRTGTHSELF